MQLALATFHIDDGDAGVSQTAVTMLGLIREGAATPMVQACAAAIARGAQRGDDAIANGYRTIGAVREWMAPRWRFMLDQDIPAAVYDMPGEEPTELLHSPEAQLRLIAAQGFVTGDCDCAAVLAGALCMAANLDVRIVCAAFGLDNVPAYVHTWCEARPFGGEEFLDLDVTRTSQQLPDSAITRAAAWSLT